MTKTTDLSSLEKSGLEESRSNSPTAKALQQQPSEPASVPCFPPVRALENTRIIGRTVSLMLRDSRLVCAQRNKKIPHGIFNRDEIQTGRLLGCGGFSEVYEIEAFNLKDQCRNWSTAQKLARDFYARNAKTEKGDPRFCIKFIKPSLMQDVKRFNMAAADLVIEAKMLSYLDHPNILKVRAWGSDGIRGYESGRHDGFFLVLDKMETTLDRKIKVWSKQAHGTTKSLEKTTNRFPLESISEQHNHHDLIERTRYALQIASALDYLHDKECIYRDLKPQNVGIDSNGNVKIFDMGLSRELPSNGGGMEDVFDMSGGVGTQRYSAPETALRKKYNLKADCYTWAVVFHEMLSLEKPYRDYSKEVHLEHCCRLGERPALLHEWPVEIRDLMENAWAEEISKRPSMKQIRQILETILEDFLNGKLRRNDAEPASVVVEIPKNFALLERAGLSRKITSNATAATSPDTPDHSTALSLDSVESMYHR